MSRRRALWRGAVALAATLLLVTVASVVSYRSTTAAWTDQVGFTANVTASDFAAAFGECTVVDSAGDPVPGETCTVTEVHLTTQAGDTVGDLQREYRVMFDTSTTDPSHLMRFEIDFSSEDIENDITPNPDWSWDGAPSSVFMSYTIAPNYPCSALPVLVGTYQATATGDMFVRFADHLRPDRNCISEEATVPTVPISIGSGTDVVFTQAPVMFQNSLNFCVVASLRNTTDAPIEWWLDVDTDIAPMWGMDPTAPGALSMSRIRTISWDPATHIWRIGGAIGDTEVIGAGQTFENLGFCTQGDAIPMPPYDDGLYDVVVTPRVDEPCLDVRVETDYAYAIPWRVRIDTSDPAFGFTPAELARLLQTSRVVATPVDGMPNTYDVTGTAFDTQLIAGPWENGQGPGIRLLERALCYW